LAHVYLLEEMIRTWIRSTTSEIVNIDKDEEAIRSTEGFFSAGTFRLKIFTHTFENTRSGTQSWPFSYFLLLQNVY